MLIIEDYYMIDFPTDSIELAHLIYNNSYDWVVVLDFFVMIAAKRHIIIKVDEISDEIKRMMEEE